MDPLTLPDRPTMADFQKYIADMVVHRNFGHETLAELFMLLSEELGELAKAARKTQGIKMDVSKANDYHPDLEAADVLIYLLTICNKLGIDLEKAFRDKEAINKQRKWA